MTWSNNRSKKTWKWFKKLSSSMNKCNRWRKNRRLRLAKRKTQRPSKFNSPSRLKCQRSLSSLKRETQRSMSLWDIQGQYFLLLYPLMTSIYSLALMITQLEDGVCKLKALLWFIKDILSRFGTWNSLPLAATSHHVQLIGQQICGFLKITSH